jgi:hypothetical protein
MASNHEPSLGPLLVAAAGALAVIGTFSAAALALEEDEVVININEAFQVASKPLHSVWFLAVVSAMEMICQMHSNISSKDTFIGIGRGQRSALMMITWALLL